MVEGKNSEAGKNAESESVENKLRNQEEDIRVKVREIYTSMHFHFQYFYLSTFVLFLFSTFLLSANVR